MKSLKNIFKNKFKLKMLIIPIITVVVLVSAIYFSYAYYLIGTENENSVVIIAGDFRIKYQQGTTLNLSSVEPIYDEYRYSRANSIPFVIENTEEVNSVAHTGGQACYAAYFDITTLFDQLTGSDRALLKYIRWELYDEINEETVSAGTFKGFNAGDSIYLTGNNVLTFGNSHSFKLYIWLSYSDVVNQLALLGKQISGSVRVESTSLTNCPVNINVASLDTTKLTVTNGNQEVAVGSNVNVGFTVLEKNTYPNRYAISLCGTIVNDDTNSTSTTQAGKLTFSNVQIGHNCTILASDDEYRYGVWAADLSYDNINTGMSCDEAQCALDTIGEMIN